MLALVWALFVGMRADLAQREAHAGIPQVAPAHPASGITWQRRLSLMMHAPSEKEIHTFIQSNVKPALEQVAKELTDRGREAFVEDGEAGAIALTSPAEDMRDFVYGVAPVSQKLPAFSAFEAAGSGLRYEARTQFSSGSKGYDIMGMTRDQIIHDVLIQYERYLLLVQSPASELVSAAPEHDVQALTEE